jgi:membrane protein DedA with SNARE-associated domain
MSAAAARCDDPATLVLTARLAPAGLALTGLALAFAIAIGAVAVPDLPGTLADATRSLDAWIYPAIAGLIFLESSLLVGWLVHGELVLVAGGVAAERGDASVLAIVALAAAAAVAGDAVSFLLGRRLGRPFLERHGRRVRLGAPQLARVDDFFARHGGKAVFLGRFTGFFRATMPFVAGSSGLAPRSLLPYSAASALVWTTAFGACGYAFSETVASETAMRITLVVVLLALGAFVTRSRWARA